MNSSTTSKIFELVASFYQEVEVDRAHVHSGWVNAARTTTARKRLKDLHLCLTASVLELLRRPQQHDRCLPSPPEDDGNLIKRANSWSHVSRILSGLLTNSHPIEEAFSIATHIVSTKDFLSLNVAALHDAVEFDVLHSYITESFNRNPELATPVDVVRAMLLLGQSQVVHCYAHQGLGLLYGAGQHTQCFMVGDEFKSKNQFLWPSRVPNEINDVILATNMEGVVTATYVGLELCCNRIKRDSDTLMVNACDLSSSTIADEYGGEGDVLGWLTNCLNAGYQKTIVLVSNDLLTAGKGRAKDILMYCLRSGLRQVVQLPKGVMGIRTEAHSILVFDQAKASQGSSTEITFTDWSSENFTYSAKKGLGHSRRSVELSSDFFSRVDNLEDGNVVDVVAYINSLGRPLISFEVSQFSKDDPLHDLRGVYDFAPLSQFVDVLRSQHVEETGDPNRLSYYEVGAHNINDEGAILITQAVTAPASSIKKREAQVLQDGDIVVCFRGSVDTFGRVGIYKAKPNVIAIPNQSFVIIRQKTKVKLQSISPDLILWWLMSSFAQKCLMQRAITHSVVRISTRVVKELLVPVAPQDLINQEMGRCQNAAEISRSIDRQREALFALKADAWKVI